MGEKILVLYYPVQTWFVESMAKMKIISMLVVAQGCSLCDFQIMNFSEFLFDIQKIFQIIFTWSSYLYNSAWKWYLGRILIRSIISMSRIIYSFLRLQGMAFITYRYRNALKNLIKKYYMYVVLPNMVNANTRTELSQLYTVSLINGVA